MLHYVKTTLRLLLILLPDQVFSQTRFYVNNDPSPPGDGLSWSQAFHNLQSAIQLAQSGDDIWVAQGTYWPTAGTDRTISFEPKSGVKIYGGFVGTETNLDQRNWQLNPTILSGDIGTQNDSLDNSYNVLYLFHPDSMTVLDGLIIRSGNADYFGAAPSRDRKKCGGGVYIDGQDGEAYPLLMNCNIDHNTARTSGGGIMINGGGIGSVAPLLKKCRIQNNHCLGNGGGIYRFGGSWVERGLDIEDCVLIRNRSDLNGAGYYYVDTERNDDIEFLRDTFESNIAPNNRGGGIYMYVGRSGHINIKILDSYFNKNESKSTPAINISTVSFLYTDTILISGNTITNHNSPSSGESMVFIGSVAKTSSFLEFSQNNIKQNHDNSKILSIEYIECNNIKISNNIIKDNFFSTLFNFSESKSITIKNNIISKNIIKSERIFEFPNIENASFINTYCINNHSENPLTMFFSKPPIKKINIENSIFSNSIFNPVFLKLPDSLSIRNTIMVNDTFNEGFYASNKYTYISNSYFKSFNCNEIIPPFNVICGPGIITGVNPLFTNPDSNDYHLQPCSPLIHAGTNAVISPGETDLDGLPRIQGGSVDIGPYESAPLSLSAVPQVTGACAQTNAGSVTLATSAACEPLQYHWSGPNGSSGNVLDQLVPGDYLLTITDAKYDTLLLNFTIPQKPQPVITAQTTPVFCGTTMAGTASLTAGNSQPPYQFDWGNGVTDAFRTGLIFGAYPVTVTDGNGCTTQSTIQINRMGNLSLQINELPISCYGASDGGITVQPDNGAAPFQWVWEWDNGSEASITGLSAGIYNGTLTDALGCAVNWVVPLENPDSISIIADATSATGPAIADGAIHLQPQGGTGIFTATWDNGASGLDINQLLPGFYSATVTDSHGCTQTTTVEVKWSVGTASPGQEKLVKVWPNPAAEWLYVQSPSDQYHFQILDAQGRIMRTANQGDSSAWVGDLPAGVYAWQLIGLDRVWSGVWVKGGE